MVADEEAVRDSVRQVLQSVVELRQLADSVSAGLQQCEQAARERATSRGADATAADTDAAGPFSGVPPEAETRWTALRSRSCLLALRCARRAARGIADALGTRGVQVPWRATRARQRLHGMLWQRTKCCAQRRGTCSNSPTRSRDRRAKCGSVYSYTVFKCTCA